jgi:malate dehydrogenase (oxaloacetate-decarboxylating)
LAAVHATGIPLAQQTIAMFGSGSAGIGIVDLLVAAMQQEGLTEAEARQRIYSFNRYGLLVEGCQGTRPGQEGLIRKREDIAGWSLTGSDPCAISLLDVARNAKITVLVGVSAQAGVFTEEIVREMASHTPRPVIFPLSNPTSKAEAVPADLLRWTDGRALVGTGSPFAPVEVDGKLVRISQINNSYIFPGLALGILVSKAARVTDNMIMTAARTLASLSPTRTDKNAPLLPPIGESRNVGLIVGEAVARQAIADGVASFDNPETLKEQLLAYVWKADYLPYERVL